MIFIRVLFVLSLFLSFSLLFPTCHFSSLLYQKCDQDHCTLHCSETSCQFRSLVKYFCPVFGGIDSAVAASFYPHLCARLFVFSWSLMWTAFVQWVKVETVTHLSHSILWPVIWKTYWESHNLPSRNWTFLVNTRSPSVSSYHKPTPIFLYKRKLLYLSPYPYCISSQKRKPANLLDLSHIYLHYCFTKTPK